MFKNCLACTILLSLNLAALAAPPDGSDERKANATDAKPDDLFGLTKLHTLHIILTEDAWEEMQPLQAVRPNPPRDKRPPAAGPNSRDGKPALTPQQVNAQEQRKTVVSQFGYEFPYVKGTVAFHGRTYKDVGIRFKGNSAYSSSAEGLKRPFKLDFDRHVKKQRFFGLTTLNLCNNALDSSQMRESLSYHVYRAAGVPAPRTAYAEVYLTVPNRFNREYAGLYTLIEQIDKTFLKDRFGTGEGLLLKPERLMGLPHFGDDWSAYVERYQPKTAGTEATTRQFMALTRLLRDADDTTFRKEVASYVDVDEFLRYLAASVVLSNMDSFLSLGHNYYMHVHPQTKKISWLPWDLNLSFGGLMLMNADQQMDMSIRKPCAMPNRFIDRVLAIKEYDELYRKHLRALVSGPFQPATIKADMEAARQVIKEPLQRDAKAQARWGPPANPMWAMMSRNVPALDTFIDRRVASVTQQLDGKSEGKVLTWGMMPQPRQEQGGRRRGFMAPSSFLTAPVLKGVDLNKDGQVARDELTFAAGRVFADLDASKDGVVDARELVEGLNRLLAQPGFGMMVRKTEPPRELQTRRKPPSAMGPGFFLTDSLLKVIDPNHDDKVTLEEWLSAVQRFFNDADKARKGALDREALADGLDAAFPPPPGMEELEAAFTGEQKKPAGGGATNPKKPADRTLPPTPGKGGER
jgi:hypothetical protein